ncbi:MAG TPA: hypothetical protein VJ183_10240 [Chloroflexia bacterium]|nr:hypothetical protein [Chloroflexia bacterium]
MSASTTGSTLTDGSRTVLSKTAKSLEDLVTEVRANISNVDEPKAQALLETTAEVLLGLKKAYQDYEKGGENAWQ